MSAAHVRRGGAARTKARKPAVQVPKKIAKKLPVDQARANKLAGLAFSLFIAAIGIVALVALDIPSKAATSAGAAIGRAGFAVGGYQIVGLKKMDRARVDAVVSEELQKAAERSGSDKPAQLLVDVSAIRNRLLQYGWIQDARVSRRLPNSLVVDIVERKPAALWQDKEQLALVDADGVVLDRVPITQMPDLPLLIGPGANRQARKLDQLMRTAPTLQPQLASAQWVGQRRWDLLFQSGETVSLPEGEPAARAALVKFANMDKSAGLLGRGLVRIDLRLPGKMIVRLPKVPEPAGTEVAQDS
ncbi:FtsQ-type POTRA domain-containing protein [Sphingomonas piscis]|uniref:Cell division protein FtsQ n=1 Tax=Sphingomonas piscis TaxID=2714943 RepID=A0A6G7YR61_9SPHN|nr:cell division protein FtsQ/DivIB [Sphingomonas piscis]QIK79230.1 FtsQ-type POTRA domain-containing protein [Sphingomonas piscis]